RSCWKILQLEQNSSTEIAGLQVQIVKIGNEITIKCDQTVEKGDPNPFLVWYKQSLGQVPKFAVISFIDKREIRFASDFADGRFSVESDGFDLSISETKEKDKGTYFCGKVISHVVEFGSGILLSVQGKQYFVSFLNFTILNPSFNQNSKQTEPCHFRQ
uniref:Ig-like domain-containing protein n=1 Tax=Astyanax mexicanus TaxID=7994 RepID=A0A3B1J6E0_ASTMX